MQIIKEHPTTKKRVLQATQEAKEKLANVTLGLNLTDLPDWVTNTTSICDFLAALNEHAEDCGLVRVDCEQTRFRSEFRPILLDEAARILVP